MTQTQVNSNRPNLLTRLRAKSFQSHSDTSSIHTAHSNHSNGSSNGSSGSVPRFLNKLQSPTVKSNHNSPEPDTHSFETNIGTKFRKFRFGSHSSEEDKLDFLIRAGEQLEIENKANNNINDNNNNNIYHPKIKTTIKDVAYEIKPSRNVHPLDQPLVSNNGRIIRSNSAMNGLSKKKPSSKEEQAKDKDVWEIMYELMNLFNAMTSYLIYLVKSFWKLDLYINVVNSEEKTIKIHVPSVILGVISLYLLVVIGNGIGSVEMNASRGKNSGSSGNWVNLLIFLGVIGLVLKLMGNHDEGNKIDKNRIAEEVILDDVDEDNEHNEIKHKIIRHVVNYNNKIDNSKINDNKIKSQNKDKSEIESDNDEYDSDKEYEYLQQRKIKNYNNNNNHQRKAFSNVKSNINNEIDGNNEKNNKYSISYGYGDFVNRAKYH